MNVKSNYTNITNGTAKCKHCERIIKTSGNSSNLSSHLRNKHSEIFATCGQKKLSATFDKVVTISESFKSAAAFKENGHKTKEISEAIIYMICKDNMPVRCVEKEGLRGLLKKCVPHFKMPSRSTVTTMIEEKYIQCVGAVVKILSSVQDFAFTCDAVTIPNSTRSFLTITAHFIANDSLNAICLAASRMDQVSDVAKPDDVFDDFMSSHNSSILKEVRSASEENKELKLYFSLPQAAWESNPLDVWKSHKATMPGLYKVALKHLITPGSSVPSERLASAIKCVVCDARSRMTDRHIKQRVFLKSLSPKYWV
ncbi:E3 SUMO-protein ligase ZBED1-like isoform X2 [Drosophila kikkawai]|uniref:E3 SUMO-protein ligase ZBED1-like isoform X2 n=1 Tax=Drosophila kikkawai TaxID=30033 RepID=A0A6P4INB7_DROKI|nr:uncharacterized protein LOC108076114 isoform X3 [Drosophila kikkawai]